LNVQQSLVLGVIQGLTEFIPVSSTAHLILAQRVLSTGLVPRYPHTYDTFIQLGTVLPVLVYFRADWVRLLRGGLRVLVRRRIGPDLDERLAVYLVLGSIPAGVLGLLLNDWVEELAKPESRPAPLMIGIALIVVGLVMWWAEGVSRKERSVEDVRLPDAILVGAAQALALFPGVSRSGATITAGLFTGLTREAAARFSFLLMTPIMLAATAYKGVSLIKKDEAMSAGEWGGMLLATAVAALTGWLAIAFLLNYLRSRSLAVFAVYRIAAGAFAIGLYFMQ